MGNEINKIAVENYKNFCFKEGSDYIASEFALETILKLIDKFKPKKILELGMGIGSVSDTILKFKNLNDLNFEYFGTESNEFCLEQLKKNVNFYDEIVLFSELNEIDRSNKFDFIIIDGLDDSLKSIVDFCDKNAILFVEGDRKAQTKVLLELFPKNKYVNIITLEKNPPYAHEGRSVNSYKGGGQLIFTNPTNMMKLFWFLEKIKTFIKIRIKKYNRK